MLHRNICREAGSDLKGHFQITMTSGLLRRSRQSRQSPIARSRSISSGDGCRWRRMHHTCTTRKATTAAPGKVQSFAFELQCSRRNYETPEGATFTNVKQSLAKLLTSLPNHPAWRENRRPCEIYPRGMPIGGKAAVSRDGSANRIESRFAKVSTIASSANDSPCLILQLKEGTILTAVFRPPRFELVAEALLRGRYSRVLAATEVGYNICYSCERISDRRA